MMRKYLLALIILIMVFNISCNKNTQSRVEDDYIKEIEREYQNANNEEVIVEANDNSQNNIYSSKPSIPNNNAVVDNSTQGRSPANYNDNYNNKQNANYANNNYNNTQSQQKDNLADNYANNNIQSSANIPVNNTVNTVQKKGPVKATVDNFYSPWTSKNDDLVIKEIRVMIANKEYSKALNYINSYDISELAENLDLGQIYQFEGIAHYFLAQKNKNHVALADAAFKSVSKYTKIEKFKPLSLLWNGMLYQTYSTDENELNEAIDLFDQIINEYPRTRFANDAMFYKALTMKKLGKPENEYKDLLLSIKRGGFADTLIFSQVVNDYVPANALVDKEILR